MNHRTRKSGLIRFLVAAILTSTILLYPSVAFCGQMFLEHSGELLEGYTFYRGAFDLGDLDDDGREEMVIADDQGSFHVYRFTNDGFVLMGLSDPMVEDGYIVSIEILHEDVPGYMPHILLLDSQGTLHQVRYTGYMFEETATYEDYRLPGESGRIVLTNISGGGRTVIIALPNADDEIDEPVEDEDIEETDSEELESEDSELEETETVEPIEEVTQWSGMTLYRLTADGLELLTDEEIASMEEGQVYFVQELTAGDIGELQNLVSGTGRFFPGIDFGSGRAGIADLDRDALFELLIAMSDPDQPMDHLEIWSEEEGEFIIKIRYELPLINEMVIGDIDGDNFSEIVGITYEGTVLVYQYDPLTVIMADGTEISWDAPHRRIDDTIWMSLAGFEALGCEALQDPDLFEVSFDGHIVVFNRTDGLVRCGNDVIEPDVPQIILDATPYLPFFISLECLGLVYTYDPDRNLVEVEEAG